MPRKRFTNEQIAFALRQAMMAAPDFRGFRTTMLPAETLATVQGLPSADRALA